MALQFLLEGPVLIALVGARSGKWMLLRARFRSSFFLEWAVFILTASVGGPLL